MEYYLVRAMMIGMLSTDQINLLHKKEQNIGRGLMPSELIDCMGKGSIKDYYGIPDDMEDQTAHSNRVDGKIRQHKLLKTESPGLVCSVNVEKLHEFDWGIFHKMGDIDLPFEGNQKLKGKLRDFLKAVPMALWIPLLSR